MLWTLPGIVYDCDRASLQALLPTGYEIDRGVTQTTVLFEAMNLRNLPWLAGRGESVCCSWRITRADGGKRLGYNTLGVYVNDVVCTISKQPVKASYLLVLFENFCDPIVTGREELGFP